MNHVRLQTACSCREAGTGVARCCKGVESRCRSLWSKNRGRVSRFGLPATGNDRLPITGASPLSIDSAPFWISWIASTALISRRTRARGTVSTLCLKADSFRRYLRGFVDFFPHAKPVERRKANKRASRRIEGDPPDPTSRFRFFTRIFRVINRF